MKKRVIGILLVLFIILAAIPAIASVKGETEERDVARFSMLVIDASASMEGHPMDKAKEIAVRFCNDVLNKADGKNYVAVVSYSDRAKVESEFLYISSDDNDLSGNNANHIALTKAIKSIEIGVFSNMYAGLDSAGKLFEEDKTKLLIEDYRKKGKEIVKNILIFSDGLPNEGKMSDDVKGSVTNFTKNENQYNGWRYANSCYQLARVDWKDKGYDIYTLGLLSSVDEVFTFTNIQGEEQFMLLALFARNFLSSMANQSDDTRGFYQNPKDQPIEFRKGSGKITNATGQTRYGSLYYYYDDYFKNNSFAVYDNDIGRWKYDNSLATMSMCLAVTGSSVGRSSFLFKDMGFEDYWANKTLEEDKPSLDTIGVAIAQKSITVNSKDVTLVAVVIRGDGYDPEWANSVTLGASGKHKGFEDSSMIVKGHLNDYLEEHKISGDIKLWITGFSRAGGVANLLGGHLDDEAYRLGGAVTLGRNDYLCTVRPENMYTFCFEVPMGAMREDVENKGTRYHNIVNIVNPNDIVTKVAQAAYNFRRYGIDIVLPTAVNTSNYHNERQRMLEKYDELNDLGYYTVDTFQMKKFEWVLDIPPFEIKNANYKPMSYYLDDLINTISATFGSRSSYARYYENDIRDIFSLYMGSNSDQQDKLKKALEDILDRTSVYISLFGSIIPIAEAFFPPTEFIVQLILFEALGTAGMLNSDNLKIVDRVTPKISYIARDLIRPRNNRDKMVTLKENTDQLKMAHWPELCLAWLMSRDRFYNSTAFWTEVLGSYRVIRINCPVNVEVYLDNRKVAAIYDGVPKANNAYANVPAFSKVASIYNDEPKTTTGYTIVTTINEDEEKLVFLPADADYEVRLEATANGVMSISINEHCFETGNLSGLINYYEIPITSGDEFTMSFPQFEKADILKGIENGSETSKNYSLSRGNGKLSRDVALKGKSAAEALYEVTVSADEKGYVNGEGVRRLGSFAKVEAVPLEGYEFAGWYKDGKLISADAKHRFLIKKDESLKANFVKSFHTVTFVNWDGTVLKSQDVKHGESAKSPADPTRNGFTFIGWNPADITNISDSIKVTAQYKPNNGSGSNMDYILKFSNNLKNESGDYPIVNSFVGKQNYVDGRNGAKAINFDYQNYLTLDKANDLINYNQSFSIAFWINVKSTAGTDPVIMSNKNWLSGDNNGWLFTATGSMIKLNSRSSKDSGRINGGTDIEISRYTQGEWIHIAAI
jgi:uncharacterized repeat protein (TIGR02543 family)